MDNSFAIKLHFEVLDSQVLKFEDVSAQSMFCFKYKYQVLKDDGYKLAEKFFEVDVFVKVDEKFFRRVLDKQLLPISEYSYSRNNIYLVKYIPF